MRSDDRELVLADIPGLIEGAHEGHGLGDRFLGHVERCRALLHLIDATGEHAGKDYKIVRGELAAYGAGLAEKPEIVALSKIDAVDADHLKKQRERLKRAIASAGPETHDRHPAPLLLSSASGAGVREALRAVFDAIEAQKAYERASEAEGPWNP